MTPGTLVYVYGPPAVGKLTVATELAERTSYRLFHNHLTVNALLPVFDFGSPPFAAVLHRHRLDVFETAARHGVNLIFTNNSVWRVPEGRARFAEFAEEARRRVAASGGRTFFVQLTAPDEVLVSRVADESRREHGKLLDEHRLRELLRLHDPGPLHTDDLVIDTSDSRPTDAAAAIADYLHAGREGSAR